MRSAPAGAESTLLARLAANAQLRLAALAPAAAARQHCCADPTPLTGLEGDTADAAGISGDRTGAALLRDDLQKHQC
jgi:hypothetical protein